MSPELMKGLKLERADERNKRVRRSVYALRHEADCEQHHYLAENNDLSPVYLLHVLVLIVYYLGDINTDEERRQRYQVFQTQRRFSLKHIYAHKDDVSRLCVRKNAAAAAVRICVLITARQDDKNRRYKRIRHLLSVLVQQIVHSNHQILYIIT